MKKKILFLGYSSKETKIIDFLKKKNYKVISYNQKKPNKLSLTYEDTVISFGYRKIFKKNILKKLKYPPINLHMSYLPYI